ncbi:MAG: hypothetical protein V4542_11045 [Pseudomonadota bacterium]
MNGINADLAIEDFTELGYAKLLSAAIARFRFVGFDSAADENGVAIWRHDIDMSPHRALKMAEIEADVGVRAYYFVMLGSRFYNACEPSVISLLKKIASLGHIIGLHFDASAYSGNLAVMEAALKSESILLSGLLDKPIECFSIHNPTAQSGAALTGPLHADLVNASSSSLVKRFTYCSDSNGVWRHRRLMDLVNDPSIERLYALTHPEWWTAMPLRPRERVQLCIDGRARQVGADYDIDVAQFGRPNY